MLIAILCIFALVVPFTLQWLAKRYSWIDKVGAVTLCYIAGIIFGNLPGVQVPEDIGTDLSGAVISIAIPLLLFSSDFSVWRKLGKQLLLSFLCCVIAVTIAVIFATYLFRNSDSQSWMIGSMMMGVYTGGTPNLMMIGNTLGIEAGKLVVINGTEMLFGGIWLLFLLTAAKPFFRKILKADGKPFSEVQFNLDETLYRRTSPIALLIGIIILGAGYGLATLFPVRLFDLIILLVVTTCGLLFSMLPLIRRLKGSYGMGNFLLLIFCVILGSMADIHKVLGAAPTILGFVATVLAITIALHLLLSLLFHIDSDTFIIGSAAGIYGPPFIAPVAKAIRNPQLISVGIALGLLGLAVGNYLGVGISQLLRQF